MLERLEGTSPSGMDRRQNRSIDRPVIPRMEISETPSLAKIRARPDRRNDGTVESVSVSPSTHVHRSSSDSGSSRALAWDESRPINRRSYQELLFTGRQ